MKIKSPIKDLWYPVPWSIWKWRVRLLFFMRDHAMFWTYAKFAEEVAFVAKMEREIRELERQMRMKRINLLN